MSDEGETRRLVIGMVVVTLAVLALKWLGLFH